MNNFELDNLDEFSKLAHEVRNLGAFAIIYIKKGQTDKAMKLLMEMVENLQELIDQAKQNKKHGD